MIGVLQTALSGLNAAAKKVQAVASNVANVQTEGSLEPGGQAPYTPLTVNQTTQVDSDGNPLSVRSEFAPRDNPFAAAYNPNSPFADENGIVGVPNVNLAEEAVNLQIAKTAYKANLGTIKTANAMTDALLSIFDKKV